MRLIDSRCPLVKFIADGSHPFYYLWLVVDDGYGLAYAVNARSLRFTITSMNKSAEGVGKSPASRQPFDCP